MFWKSAGSFAKGGSSAQMQKSCNTNDTVFFGKCQYILQNSPAFGCRFIVVFFGEFVESARQVFFMVFRLVFRSRKKGKSEGTESCSFMFRMEENEENAQKREKKRAFHQLNQNNQKNCKKGIDKPYAGWYNSRVREKNPNISEEKTNVYLHGKSRNR